MADLERESRRLSEFVIEGRPVYARAITNADLERKDELDDEAAEMRLELEDLERQIEECKDALERRGLRALAREKTATYRDRDVLMLQLYIEDEDGNPFPDEHLLALPFRVTAKLSKKASEYAFGVDEEARPTTATSGSG